MNRDENEIKRETKLCSVCGDQALGYNFNAVACESCKAFFRRNAWKDKELRCPFKESCEITPLTRRFCQKCRLDKCLNVGMKRELIMSDEDKERKRKRKHNTLPHQEQQVTSTSPKLGCDVSIQTDFPLCLCSLQGCQLVPPQPLSCPARPRSRENEGQATPLSVEDKIILNELITANKDLEAPLDQELTSLPGDEFKRFGSESLIDVINLTAVAIRRLIKLCKRVWGFRSLPQGDQLTLLKQGCTQLMLLRSVISYDPEKKSWKIPTSVEELSSIKIDVLQKVGENQSEPPHDQVYQAWLHDFDSRASQDVRVICLLSAISLFDPTRSHLQNRETIRLIQERYFQILQRYLESLYRLSEAHEIYSNLMRKISELRRINEMYVRVYLNVDPTHVEPLLIEIFDLKS